MQTSFSMCCFYFPGEQLGWWKHQTWLYYYYYY